MEEVDPTLLHLWSTYGIYIRILGGQETGEACTKPEPWHGALYKARRQFMMG
jgi:hypothetical protein